MTDAIQRLTALLREKGELSTAQVGEELWHQNPVTNPQWYTHPQRYTGPAARLLNNALNQGLVRKRVDVSYGLIRTYWRLATCTDSTAHSTRASREI